MQVYVIYNPNGPHAKKSAEVRVHKRGCRDIGRELRQNPTSHYSTAGETETEIAEDFWADFIEEESMTAADAMRYTEFLPCTRELPRGESSDGKDFGPGPAGEKEPA